MNTLLQLAAHCENVQWDGRHCFTARCPRREHGVECRAHVKEFLQKRRYSCSQGELKEVDFTGEALRGEHQVVNLEVAQNVERASPALQGSTPAARANQARDATAPASGEPATGAVSVAASHREEDSRVAPVEGVVKRGTVRAVPHASNGAGRAESLPALRIPDVVSWKLNLYDRVKGESEGMLNKAPLGPERELTRGILAGSTLDSWVASLNKHRNLPSDGLTRDPALTPVEIDEELQWLATQLRDTFRLPAVQNGHQNGNGKPALSLIVTENAEQAIIANQEYLSRPAIVERLYYTQHISLGVGGKHEGKTTNVRTEALAIALGAQEGIYGRAVMQTPVIYAASDDEYPSTRMELLRMGWNPSIPLIMVKVVTEEGNVPEPERVLVELARRAEMEGSRFIVLDMLFDFVRIQDEIKYAQTREAIGKIQILADAIKGHVRSTHHSPKWMPDAATAAKAALGSQGIAARFSPILLSKQWAKDLYTIESTTTRDPRGMAIPVTVMEKNDLGWAVAKGEMKSWMKWKVYAERIMDLFESSEPGSELTVNYVVQSLEISRQEIQNAMRQMTLGDGPALYRTKIKGNSYKYGLINNGTVSPGMEPDRPVIPPVTDESPLARSAPRERRVWGDEDDELDANGIPKGR